MNLISNLCSELASGGPRPAAGTRFALIDRLPVLFSEESQKLFELNDLSAFIWCSLQEGAAPEGISAQLVDRGLSAVQARMVVRNTLEQWMQAGLLVPQFDASRFTHRAAIGRSMVEITTSDSDVLDLLRSLFVATSEPDSPPDVQFAVHRMGDTAIVLHHGRKAFECPLSALAPAFRAHAIEHLVLAGDARDVIFHAAAVMSGEHGMLISAPPGAGKSTLTIHLLHAGFGYVTDDIVMFGPAGDVWGVALAPSLKSGSWPLVEKLRPDIGSLPIHSRLDGKVVRYLDATPNFHGGPVAVKWMVFLERAPDCGAPALVGLSELETIRRIVSASFANGGRLSRNGFDVLKNMAASTRAFVLHYAEAEHATHTLLALCNDKS